MKNMLASIEDIVQEASGNLFKATKTKRIEEDIPVLLSLS